MSMMMQEYLLTKTRELFMVEEEGPFRVIYPHLQVRMHGYDEVRVTSEGNELRHTAANNYRCGYKDCICMLEAQFEDGLLTEYELTLLKEGRSL